MELERRLAHEMLGDHPQDATVVLEGLPLEEAVGFLSHARPESAARILQWGAPHFAAAVLGGLAESSAAEVIDHLPPEVAAGLLRRMPEATRGQLLAAVSPRCARAVGPLLRFPPGTAGALMDTRALGITDDLSAQDALDRLRQDTDGILFDVYVLDRSDRLVGAVNLRDLLSAPPASRVDALMRTPVPALRPLANAATILGHPAWKRFHSLAVVDEHGVLLGAVRYRTYRRLEAEAVRSGEDPQAATARALGELFSVGVGGIMGAVMSALEPAAERRDAEEDR